jgi:hypothetical protein
MSRGLGRVNTLLEQLKKAVARIAGRTPTTPPRREPMTDAERKRRLEAIRQRMRAIRERNKLKP